MRSECFHHNRFLKEHVKWLSFELKSEIYASVCVCVFVKRETSNEIFHLWGTLKCWVIFLFCVLLLILLFLEREEWEREICMWIFWLHEFKAMLKYFLALCFSPSLCCVWECYISHIIKLCKFCARWKEKGRIEIP